MLFSLLYFLVRRLLGAGTRRPDERDIELLVAEIDPVASTMTATWARRSRCSFGRMEQTSRARVRAGSTTRAWRSRCPAGLVAVNDDFRARVIVLDPGSGRIVWQYGRTDPAGSGPGHLFIPDGLAPIPAAVLRGL